MWLVQRLESDSGSVDLNIPIDLGRISMELSLHSLHNLHLMNLNRSIQTKE